MTPRTIPWTAHSASLDAYHRRYGGHPVGDGEYVYRYDGTETVQTTVPSARWHPGDTFRVLDRIDQPGWTRVDEEGNAIDNDVLLSTAMPEVILPVVTPEAPRKAPVPASPPKAVVSPPKPVVSPPKPVVSPPKASPATPKAIVATPEPVTVPPAASPVKATAKASTAVAVS